MCSQDLTECHPSIPRTAGSGQGVKPSFLKHSQGAKKCSSLCEMNLNLNILQLIQEIHAKYYLEETRIDFLQQFHPLADSQ